MDGAEREEVLSLSPFQQGHRVDGEGQGVDGNLAYAFSLKPVEVVHYLFCFPLCKGGVFIDGEHCTSARVVWRGGMQGLERHNAVVGDEAPSLHSTDYCSQCSDLPGAVCIPAVTMTGNPGHVETTTPKEKAGSAFE